METVNFKVNRKELVKGLDFILSAIPIRTPKFILRTVKIDACNGHAVLTGTDLEVSAIYTLPSETQTQGTICLSGEKLYRAAKSAKCEVVEILGGSFLTENAKMQIESEDPENFPIIDNPKADHHLMLDYVKVKEGMNKAQFSMAKESTRYALNGMLWEFEEGTLRLVGTDGRRLSIWKYPDMHTFPDIQKFIMPSKAIKVFGKIKPNKNVKLSTFCEIIIQNAKMEHNKDGNYDYKSELAQVRIVVDQYEIITRELDGNFPKYQDIIPQYKNTIVMEREPFLSAIRSAAQYATQEDHGVAIEETEEGYLSIWVGSDKRFVMGVPIHSKNANEPIYMAVNPSFMIDALTASDNETIEIRYGEYDRPIVVSNGFTDKWQCIIITVNIEPKQKPVEPEQVKAETQSA